MPLKRLMVLTDYTAASSMAAAHCYQVAALSSAEVLALHVISHEEDVEWAGKKTEEQIRKVANYDAGIRFKSLVSSQNLFSGFNTWLEGEGIQLTFMATHGKKDLQFVTGSNALKLIFNAEAPVLVVQHTTTLRPYRHILIPVNSRQAEMQFPVEALQTIVGLFQSRVTLLTPAVDSDQEKAAMHKSIGRITELLGPQVSALEIRTSDKPEKKFNKEVVSVAKEIDADLVAAFIGSRHHRDEAERNKKFFQSLITNEHGIPVLCL